ncbi:MAG: GTP-binding protein, partial [Myxococcota bacterium]
VELLSDENSSPVAGHLVDRVAALHGTHAREQLHASVGRTLDEIAVLDPAPPHVLCESTGAARPWPLIVALTQNGRFRLRHFIVTVDALNLHRDFADGRVFSGEAAAPEDGALRYAAEILAEQLFFASVIIITKIDTVHRSIVDAQVSILKKLQPQATIGLSADAGLLLKQLDATPAPQLTALKKRAEQLGLPSNAPTAAQVNALVLRDPRPFHPQRLYDVCQSQLGTGVYRTKGFLWLASRPADVFLWQQSGSQVALEITRLWRAEAIKNTYGKLMPSEVEILSDQLKAAHPIFGDRNNELTLIGLPAACGHFAEALRSALCTEDEVADWQRGATFPDPWPKSVRTLR